MKRALAWAIAVAMVAGALATDVLADRKLSMRTIDCDMFRRLPAMHLVVRDAGTLVKLGVADMVDMDFKKEMGLFVSLGPDKNNLEGIRIKAVRETADKIVVETEKFGFEQMLTQEDPPASYEFVVVPASTLPVEGFVEKIAPCEGLCAVSSLVPVRGEISFTGFKERAEARKYTAQVVRRPAGIIKAYDWLESVAWDVGPEGDRKGIRIRFYTIKAGAGTQCTLEFARPKYAPAANLRDVNVGRGRTRKRYVCPADPKLIAEGVAVAYAVSPALSMQVAEQVFDQYGKKNKWDEGMIDIPAIRASQIQPKPFQAWVQSDGKHFVCAGGNGIEKVDEVGTRGSLRWLKPYARATRDEDDLGRVTLSINEVGMFQTMIENVKTTDVDEIRRKVERMARRVGIRFDDGVLEAATFSFYVRQ